MFCDNRAYPRKGAWPSLWPYLNPFCPRMLCANFYWNWPCGPGEKFKISSMYFQYFIIISSCERVWPFFWTKFDTLYPKMFCTKFRRHWSSGSWEEDKNIREPKLFCGNVPITRYTGLNAASVLFQIQITSILLQYINSFTWNLCQILNFSL